MAVDVVTTRETRRVGFGGAPLPPPSPRGVTLSPLPRPRRRCNRVPRRRRAFDDGLVAADADATPTPAAAAVDTAVPSPPLPSPVPPTSPESASSSPPSAANELMAATSGNDTMCSLLVCGKGDNKREATTARETQHTHTAHAPCCHENAGSTWHGRRARGVASDGASWASACRGMCGLHRHAALVTPELQAL